MTAVIVKVVEHDTFARNRRLARVQAVLHTPHRAAGATQKQFPFIEVAFPAVRGDNGPVPSVAS